MRVSILAAVVACWLVSAGITPGVANDPSQNWPQWRGPQGDGVASPEADPPVRWSEEENIRWKTPIPGRGSSTPVVWNDRIYLLTAVPSEEEPTEAAADPQAEVAQEEARPRGQRGRGPGRFGDGPPRGDRQAGRGPGGRRGGPGGGFPGRGGPGGGRGGEPIKAQQFTLVCVDRGDGEILWQKVLAEAVPHERLHQTNTYASASAVTDGDRLYASFGSFGIFCLDMEGNEIWKRELGQMQTRAGFGEGGSPALYGDTLVVPWDHEGPSALIALDAATGETRWQVERDEQTTWATPLITEHDGRVQVVTNGAKRVRSYDLETGELLWECGGQAENPIPSPVRMNDTVICSTGYRGYAVYAIPLASSGDITDSTQVAWQRTDTGPYISSPVLYKGRLYVTKSRDAILSVLDAETGEEVAGPKRLTGLDTLYASPVAAADRIYFSARNGNTVVLQAGDAPEILATNRLDETIDASPVPLGNQLLIRGEQHLYCIEES